MANPGSPQQMQQNMPPMPGMSKSTMIGGLAAIVIMAVFWMFREKIGEAINVVFEPLLGFGGQWPVLTLVLAGLIMITLSTVVRTFMTDFISQARNQKISSDFNKEMKQARRENNLYKLKKLQEEQPKMMAKSMETSTSMMKIMPITMIIAMPIITWIGYFFADGYYHIEHHVSIVPPELLRIALPWGTVDILDRVLIMPMWIIIYMMISLPVGQLENRIVRYFLLKKRLKELDGIEYKS